MVIALVIDSCWNATSVVVDLEKEFVDLKSHLPQESTSLTLDLNSSGNE